MYEETMEEYERRRQGLILQAEILKAKLRKINKELNKPMPEHLRERGSG